MIYSQWLDNTTGVTRNTYAIVTTEANELMAEVHNIKKRMPIILKQENELKWLQHANYKEFGFPYSVDLIAKNLNSQTSLFKYINMKNFISTLIFIAVLLISQSSFAWGEKGHNLVAEVAFNYLDANTKAIVKEYLGEMTIQQAANWMDDIKSDKQYNYMRKLHYINADRGQSIIANEEENIVGALTKTINELKNYKALPKEEVKIKICILFHLIGDLHQPLHVGYGDDKGGNSFQLNFYGKGTNLHAFYDSGIIEFKGLTLIDCINAKKYTKEERDEIKKMDVTTWANESRSHLKSIYNTGSFKIDEMYVNNNYPIIKEQILKAGIRLSSTLQSIFI